MPALGIEPPPEVRFVALYDPVDGNDPHLGRDTLPELGVGFPLAEGLRERV